jgi:hypothetical protein
MPPDLPDGETPSYLVMIGSDLRRVWWGAWGDLRGVAEAGDYRLQHREERAALLDQIGELLEPKLVGSWIGVWGGKVTTGWHFLDPHPWSKVETMFGTHEAKYRLKKLVEEHGIERIERFTQSIGDNAYSELELAMPGDTVDAQVAALSSAFVHFTGAPLEPVLLERMRAITAAVRARGPDPRRSGHAGRCLAAGHRDDGDREPRGRRTGRSRSEAAEARQRAR